MQQNSEGMQHVPIYMYCSDRRRPTHSPLVVFLFGLPPFYFVPYLSIIHSSSMILGCVFVAWHKPIPPQRQAKNTGPHCFFNNNNNKKGGGAALSCRGQVVRGQCLFICSRNITPCLLWKNTYLSCLTFKTRSMWILWCVSNIET